MGNPAPCPIRVLDFNLAVVDDLGDHRDVAEAHPPIGAERQHATRFRHFAALVGAGGIVPPLPGIPGHTDARRVAGIGNAGNSAVVHPGPARVATCRGQMNARMRYTAHGVMCITCVKRRLDYLVGRRLVLLGAGVTGWGKCRQREGQNGSKQPNSAIATTCTHSIGPRFGRQPRLRVAAGLQQ